MTVFKTILKILNKKKGMLILYTAILISITVLNQTSGSNAVDFEDSKPDVLIVNKDGDNAITKGFTDYISKHSEIKDIEPMRIENDRQREAKYKEALVSCDCKQLICIIKTMYARNKERIAKGKRITYVDDRYLKEAKQNLNDEFSIALGIEPREVEKYIKAQIVEQEA